VLYLCFFGALEKNVQLLGVIVVVCFESVAGIVGG
jgi:hypothetical protein